LLPRCGLGLRFGAGAACEGGCGLPVTSAQDKARERYEGLTKAELSDLLDQRSLPKTGNVDEPVERLVEADSK
jgi:hypothetical protein